MTGTGRGCGLRTGIGVGALLAVLAATSGCGQRPVPVAKPEPVASTSRGAVEFYSGVQRDILTALSAEFPGLHFTPRFARSATACTLPDDTVGTLVHLPIYGSEVPVPADALSRAADVFEKVAARAGFHEPLVMPPDVGFAFRMFAADGSYITFGSYIASTVALTTGCYRE